jgi:hypothetical protein
MIPLVSFIFKNINIKIFLINIIIYVKIKITCNKKSVSYQSNSLKKYILKIIES